MAWLENETVRRLGIASGTLPFQVMSQFEPRSPLISLRTSDSEVAMKAVGATIIILVALYFTDQYFAEGRYTDAAQRMAMQIRHSAGI